MTSSLRALADLVNQSVGIIESRCAELGVEFPSIDEPFTIESEVAHNDPEVAKAAATISNAAYQLGLVSRPAVTAVFTHAGMSYNTAALRVALELHVPDILRPAGSAGLHARDIAKTSKTDANKLSRVLRLLASHGIFKEVAPDVFANNRISSTLCKGKSAEDLFSNPDKMYDNPEASLAAVVGHVTDEATKGAAFLYEHLVDPATAFSGDPTCCPVQKAFNTKLSFWELLELPENSHRLARFGVAMQGITRLYTSNILLNGFDWASLPPGSVVVDVGGGIGTMSMALAKAQPGLKIIVQDRPTVVADGLKAWEQQHKEALSSGQVSFQAHDFFLPQPVKDASVFFMRGIIHDWSDEFAAKILVRLREAAQPHTKLLVMDQIIPYACRTPDDGAPAVPGLLRESAPEILSVNVGAGGPNPYLGDMTGRTITHAIELHRSCGWKITRVCQLSGSGQASLIEAVPV